jgi:hypothetical protein
MRLFMTVPKTISAAVANFSGGDSFAERTDLSRQYCRWKNLSAVCLTPATSLLPVSLTPVNNLMPVSMTPAIAFFPGDVDTGHK